MEENNGCIRVDINAVQRAENQPAEAVAASCSWNVSWLQPGANGGELRAGG